MPVGPYETMEECIADNQDKDDPGAFCGWLKEQTSSTKETAVGRVIVNTPKNRASFETVELDDEMLDADMAKVEAGARWEGILTVEGEMTGDSRMFEPGAVRWETLPVPLRWVREDVGEHDGAVVVGRIDEVWRDGKNVMGRGVFDVGSEDGREAMRQVAENLTPGISVDLDDVSFEIRVRESAVEPVEVVEEQLELNLDEAGRETVLEMTPDDEVMVTTDARLRAATIVATPAFADARIYVLEGEQPAEAEMGYLDDEDELSLALSAQERTPTEGMQTEAQRALDWRADGNAGGEENTVQRARSIAAGEPLGQDTIRRMHAFFSRNARYPDEQGFSPGEDGYPSAARVAWGLWGGDAGASWSSTLVERMNRDESALIAASALASRGRPPSSFFVDPKLNGATPLTVLDDGRVFGHLATWGTCHTGFPGECVQPPSSATGYAYFRTGSVRTSDGVDVAVGRITLDTTHAGRRLGANDTSAHYEHTGAAVADVAAGEDEHGIWVAGTIRPGVTDEQIRTLQASPLSGDWRRVGGNLELIAALAVNSPGFPIPRVLVAGGSVQTLQSSGVVAAIPANVERETISEDDAALRRLIERERVAMREQRRAVEQAKNRILVASAASRFRAAVRS